ncbi:MAG: asparaginase [Pseudanabaenaceae cyanobacterium]
MNAGKRSRVTTPCLTVQLLREGIVESVHSCQAAIVDHRGRVLSVAGSASTVTFARSVLKPIQAIALLNSGAMSHWQLAEADLAIACGSHQGTVAQARQVFHLLWQCNLDAEVLQCPIPEGKSSPLQHNCSGKHAGMLAVCQMMGWNVREYMDKHHPVQQLILQIMAEMLHMPSAEFISARDDCGVPTYLLELGQLGHLFAQLVSSDRLQWEMISRAMIQYPEMVAGSGKFDTELMMQSEGTLISKSGAEGVQCVARVGEGLALALKVADGSARARNACTIHLLQQLGWLTPAGAEKLADSFLMYSPYSRLETVGELS